VFQAKSIEDMEEYQEEMELKLDVKFNALQNCTLNKLKSVNVDLEALEKRVNAIELNDSKVNIQEEFDKIDDSIGSLRLDLETVKASGASSSPLSGGPQDYGRKHKSITTEDTHKKKFCGFSFSALSSPSNAARQPVVKVPYTLTDIEDSV
jgi:hypothetical protein